MPSHEKSPVGHSAAYPKSVSRLPTASLLVWRRAPRPSRRSKARRNSPNRRLLVIPTRRAAPRRNLLPSKPGKQAPKTVTPSAPVQPRKRRKNAAHSASCGIAAGIVPSPEGAKETRLHRCLTSDLSSAPGINTINSQTFPPKTEIGTIFIRRRRRIRLPITIHSTH